MPAADVKLNMNTERSPRVRTAHLWVPLRPLVIAAVLALAVFTVACEQDAQVPPIPDPQGPPVTSTAPAGTAPGGPGLLPPDTPVSSTPGPRTTPTAIPTSGTPVAEPGRTLALAPIENVEVVSTKPQAVIRVGSGLPSGCARWAGATVEHRRAEIIVDVYNSMPAGPVACTAIYGYTTHDIVLGPLSPGSYKLRVNDRTIDLLVQ